MTTKSMPTKSRFSKLMTTALVAGSLMATALVTIVATTTSPVSAQAPSIDLANTIVSPVPTNPFHSGYEDNPQENPVYQVRVTWSRADGCNSDRSGGPANGNEYILDARYGGGDPIEPESTGAIPENDCDWIVSASTVGGMENVGCNQAVGPSVPMLDACQAPDENLRSPTNLRCPVLITVQTEAAVTIGIQQVGSVRLIGTGDNNRFRYGDETSAGVGRISFQPLIGQTQCETVYDPRIDITIPSTTQSGGASAYSGHEFTINYEPVGNAHPDCAARDARYVFNDDGDTVLMGLAPALLHLPFEFLIRNLGIGLDVENREELVKEGICSYTARFPNRITGSGSTNALALSFIPLPVGTVTLDNQFPAEDLTPTVTATYVVAETATNQEGTAFSSITNITLRNVHILEDTETADSLSAQVRVNVVPVNECDPGKRGPSKEVYELGGAGDFDITGILSTSCNWEVRFSHATGLCAVSATLLTIGGGPIPLDENVAERIMNDASLILNSVGGASGLTFNDLIVTGIDFDIENTCASSFVPEATIELSDDAGPARDYAGLLFTVTYTSSRANCTASASATYTLSNTGESIFATAGSTAPRLIHQAFADLDKPVSRNRCEYDVSYTPEVGALRVLSTATSTIHGGGEEFPETPEVSLAYGIALVDIVVVTTFPVDRIFTTQERVSFEVQSVGIGSCAGLRGLLPSILTSAGNFVYAQALPGSTIVHSQDVNQILVGQDRTFTARAYADARGTVPCTVQVTELSAPESCPATTSVQSEQYSPGTTVMRFEFVHSCDGDSAGGGASTPPTPPSPGSGPPKENSAA